MSEDVGVLLIFWWVASMILATIVASQKRAASYGFVFGLFFGPLGLFAAAFIDDRFSCPRCGTRLNDRPDICPGCLVALKWTDRLSGPTVKVDVTAEVVKRRPPRTAERAITGSRTHD